MRTITQLTLVATSAVLVAIFAGVGLSQQAPRPPADAIQEAQTSRDVPRARPEQQQTDHDRSVLFSAPAPSSPVLDQQPDKGRETGFVFGRDPHNAKRPLQTFEEGMKADVAEKVAVSAAQRRLLETRYDLTPKLDPSARMSRGKPLAVDRRRSCRPA
jgi:hypothetical protein